MAVTEAVATALCLVLMFELQGCGTEGPQPAPGVPGTTTTAALTTTTGSGGQVAWPCPAPSPTPLPVPPPGAAIGYPATDEVTGGGQWCQVQVPEGGFSLGSYCGSAQMRFLSESDSAARVRVLTYNLYWWNLFRERRGADGSAGKNIAEAAKQQPFDLMAFQECEDVTWPLRDAQEKGGMADDFSVVTDFPGASGNHATAMAYRTAAFDLLAAGGADVAEDGAAQHFGKRGAFWMRVRHKESGKVVFFANHHGPTPVNSGGLCGREATAYNILKVIGQSARVGDRIILVGDFNSWSFGPDGHEQQEIGLLGCHLPHRFSNAVVGDVWGIDNFFSACASLVNSSVLPKGGSDHNALSAVFEL